MWLSNHGQDRIGGGPHPSPRAICAHETLPTALPGQGIHSRRRRRGLSTQIPRHRPYPGTAGNGSPDVLMLLFDRVALAKEFIEVYGCISTFGRIIGPSRLYEKLARVQISHQKSSGWRGVATPTLVPNREATET